jgi:putative alpha-1,2-mannosidase
MKVSENKIFKIQTENNSAKNIYIQSVTLNGKPYTKSFITHKNILKGGTLKFVMGGKPNIEFGKKDKDRPKSIVY